MGSDSEKTIRLKQRTADTFGFEWQKFRDIYAEYEDNFLGYIDPIGKDFFRDKLVLDAGCGAGRHSYFAAKYGARKVVGFDLSEKAVRSAQVNTAALPNAVMMQGDIYTFSYPEKFDYVLSIGVLHHLPNPQEGFDKLVGLLKDDGAISIWVYGKRDNKLALYLFEPLRKITTKLPNKLLYYLSYIPAGMMEICNRLNIPLFTYYKHFPFKTKLNDAFDVFSAPSAKYYEFEDIKKWFRDAGLRDYSVTYRILDGKAKGIKAIGVK